MRHLIYTVASQIDCRCLAYLEPKKYILKPPLKLGDFRKIAKKIRYKINLSFYSTWDIELCLSNRRCKNDDMVSKGFCPHPCMTKNDREHIHYRFLLWSLDHKGMPHCLSGYPTLCTFRFRSRFFHFLLLCCKGYILTHNDFLDSKLVQL
jgi:hypothetical protein